VTDPDAAEANINTGTLTVTRTGSTSNALTLAYTIGGTATSGSDYQPLPGSVTIPAGSASASIVVTPVDDSEVESNETVIVTLRPPLANCSGTDPNCYTLGTASGTVTIADNDNPALPVVTMAVADANASETGPDPASFTVRRSGSTTSALTVLYSIGGTATNGTDYQTLSGSLVIPAGSASATLVITPIDDAVVEGAETIILTFRSDSAYSLGATFTGTMTLADNDSLPTVSIRAGQSTLAENSPTPGNFMVERQGSTLAALTVNYSISGTAAAGVDYNSLPGSIQIPAAASSVNILVTPINDTLTEGDETVTLTLQPNASYQVGAAPQNSATLVLVDDDQSQVTLQASDPDASESGPDPGSFTLSRSGSLQAALQVNLAIGGSAANGADYATLPSQVTFAAGQASVNLTVNPLDDSLYELDETVGIQITPGIYAIGNPSSAVVTIHDNDNSTLLPQVVGNPDTVPPAGQPKATVAVGAAMTETITGELELLFQHNADSPLEHNPEILFANGTTKLGFTIPAQSQQVQFIGSPDGGFQSGTVAGTVTLKAILLSGWSQAAPPDAKVTIRRLGPMITSLTIANRTASGFDLVVTGYSTPRSLRSAQFTFVGTPGNTLNNASYSLDLGNAAITWFDSATAKEVGSNFQLTVPFTFSGDTRALASVSVVLSNVEGGSEARNAAF
jgi:hypothetical protein